MINKIIFVIFVLTCSPPSTYQQIPGLEQILKSFGLGGILTFNNGTIKVNKTAFANVDFKKVLETPGMQGMIKQSGMEPKVVSAIIESVNIKALLTVVDVDTILKMTLTGNKTGLVQSINIPKILSTFDIKSILQNQAVLEFVANKIKLNEDIVKVIADSLDYQQLINSIDWKRFMEISYINGSDVRQALLSATDLTKLFASIDMNKILQSKVIMDMVKKQIGIDTEIIKSMLGTINMNEVFKSIDLKKLIEAGMSGKTSEIMKIILSGVDPTKLIKDLNIMGIVKMLVSGLGATMPKLSLSCTAELAILAAPFRNVSSKDMMKHLFTSPLGKYVDSWGKPPSRILIGNLNWFGAYDECKSIPNAKYCLASMSIMGQMNGSYGTCLPNGCSYEDNLKILNTMGKALAIPFSPFPGVSCEEKHKEYKTGFIITLVLCIIILMLCILGTVVDSLAMKANAYEVKEIHDNIAMTKIKDDPEAKQVLASSHDEVKESASSENGIVNLLACFSILKNNRAVLSTNSPKGAIESINGIRTISMMWIILGHQYSFMLTARLPDNAATIMTIAQRYSFQALANAYVSVDTFFLLSGLLVAYLALRRMDKSNGKLNVPMFYLHRFIRLTPPYMFVILFWNNIYPMMVTGPTSDMFRTDVFQENCNKYWWTNLLYINNLHPHDMTKECLGWSWYLANDMQFYVFSPVVLYIMYYWEKKFERTKLKYFGSVIITIIGCALCFIINASLIGVKDLPSLITAAFMPGNTKVKKLMIHQNEIYVKPWTRISPYLIGLLLGYALSRKIEMKMKYRKVVIFICWVAAVLIAYGVIYGPYSAFKPGGEFFTKSEDIAYGSLHRLAFAISVGWVIYACHNKVAGLIDNFLSWRIFIPLSRLTFGAYLLHPMVITYFFMAHENQIHYQDNTFAFYYISCTFVSYACAYILAVFLEYPIMNMEKMIFKSK